MTSSIFGASGNSVAEAIKTARQMAHGNPQGLYNQMLRTNPQFKAFVEANKGKSPQQIARENGIDFNQIVSLL